MSLILTEDQGDVTTLRLNRPERGNALNEELLGELKNHIEKALGRPNLKAMVLTGAGERAFCTGADLRELVRGPSPLMFELFTDVLALLAGAPVLTASFLNGDCLGGAVGLAVSTDFVLAREGIRIGTPEITKGVFPFMISKSMATKLGYQRAMAMTLSGKIWDARQAFELGVVSESVGAEEFAARGHALVALWSALPRSTILNGKAAFAQPASMSAQKLIGFLTEHLAGKKAGEDLGKN